MVECVEFGYERPKILVFFIDTYVFRYVAATFKRNHISLASTIYIVFSFFLQRIARAIICMCAHRRM